MKSFNLGFFSDPKSDLKINYPNKLMAFYQFEWNKLTYLIIWQLHYYKFDSKCTCRTGLNDCNWFFSLILLHHSSLSLYVFLFFFGYFFASPSFFLLHFLIFTFINFLGLIFLFKSLMCIFYSVLVLHSRFFFSFLLFSPYSPLFFFFFSSLIVSS